MEKLGASYEKKIIGCGLVFAMLIGSVGLTTKVYAKSDDNKYSMGEVQKKNNAGYEKNANIKSKDVHYGWNLGEFCVSGFTRTTRDENGNIVFLKNVGDTITLSFALEQDIDALNGNDGYHISRDTNGYDEYFNIPKTERMNFGQDALLIKKTDYQNKITYPAPYTDYLKGVKKGANTEVQFFEEGDYEVALDYEIQNNKFHLGKWRPFDDFTHYQILIKFSVRNGNCMVYPFDLVTKDELVNTSFTKNGFYIDLANSHYLNIDVKKLNYIETEGNLVEDTCFNKPASDKEEFKDEGVYVITAHNLYTDAKTEKKIYVGDDPLLKAYVTTGKELDDIKKLLDNGATIGEDGTITLATKEVIENTNEKHQIPEEAAITVDSRTNAVEKTENDKFERIIFIVIIILFLICVGVLKKRNAIKKHNKEEKEEKNV